MKARLRSLVLVFVCGGIVPAIAEAQMPAVNAPDERSRVQLGPLGLRPGIALTNFGVDTNVFNETETPKSDFTFTVTPRLDASFRMRRTRLNVATRSNLVYFQQYSSERSADGAIDGRFEVRGTRATPWVSSSYDSARQRFGYEVDLRLRRIVRDVGAGVDLRVGGRTQAVISAHRTEFEHDPDSIFSGSSVRDVLNRRSDALGVDVRYKLTPLTTFVVGAQTIRDRFPFTSLRDTDSLRVDAGFDTTPLALISGRGRVGYRTLNGAGAMPDYSGVVASVSAGSTIKGRTRVDVFSDRDVNYSVEAAYPYFLLSGVSAAVTPRLSQHWDAQARTGVQRLAYRVAEGFSNALPHRVDTYALVGAGLGYHMTSDMRIGFNIDRERRQSPVQRRDYLGYRTGISVTYGR